MQELLGKAGLPITGVKNDLIARLIEAGASVVGANSPAPEAQSAPVVPAPAVPEPALNEEEVPALASAVESKDEPAAPEAAAPAAAPAPVELTAEEKAERARVEDEKRKARQARFGLPVETAAEGKEPDALKKRAERFGVEKDAGKEDKVR